MNDPTHRKWGTAVKACAALLALALLLLLAQIGSAVLRSVHSGVPDPAWATTTKGAFELPVDARQLARLGRAALDGAEVEAEFRTTRARVAAQIQQVIARTAEHPQLQADATAMISAWAEMETAAGQLHDNLGALQEMAASDQAFFAQEAEFKGQLDALVRAMVATGSAASQVYLALHQMVLLDEMARQVETIGTGGDHAALAATELIQAIATFDRVLAGLRRGDAEIALRRLQGRSAQSALAQVEAQWSPMRVHLNTIVQHTQARLVARSALGTLERGADLVLASIPLLLPRPDHTPPAPLRLGGPWVALGSTVMALLAALGLWQALRLRRRHWSERAAQLRHREQDAFAQLLDEMGALAEGDLTVKASFSEDATGALADAINFIAQQLGARVQAMTHAIAPISATAEDARQMAIQFAEVSQYQRQELNAALAKVHSLRAGTETILARFGHASHGVPQAAVEALGECSRLSADLAAMLETLYTVTTQLEAKAAQAVPSMDTLTQSAATLREAANGFVLPP